MKNVSIRWITWMVILLLTSCKDQTPEPNNDMVASQVILTRIEGVTIVNGRLRFSSQEIYKQVLQQLHLLKYSQLAQWERQNLPGFTSMRAAYENLTEADMQKIAQQNSNEGYEGFLTIIGNGDNQEVVMNVDVGFVGTLINRDGLLQIDKKIIKAGYSETKVAETSSEEDLKQLLASNWKNEGNRKIETYPVIRSLIPLNNARTTGREATCEDRYKSDRRFKTELWITNLAPIYTGAGARAKHQNRFMRIWWSDNAPEIRLQVEGNFIKLNAGLCLFGGCDEYEFVRYDSDVQYDQSIIEWVWKDNFAPGFDERYDASATVTSSGIGDDGGLHGCSVQ
jgi:hypothetical protein